MDESKRDLEALPSGVFSDPEKYAVINKMTMRDLNSWWRTHPKPKYLYKKDDIIRYLGDPYHFSRQLRRVLRYIYGASPHFRRLIAYFASLTDFAYVVAPYRIDPLKANKGTVSRNYRRVLNTLSIMNIKTQFRKIVTVCLREDVYFATMRVSADSIIIQQLPSDYCAISTVENNVCNVTFNFSYFDNHPKELEFFPDEFKIKYEEYKSWKDRYNHKWIELDAPTSFAIKCTNDILRYPIPPFAGLVPDILNLDIYKDLRLDKAALENYAMVFMKLPMDADGNWAIEYKRAKEFWQNLDSVLPEEVGSVLTPMDIEKISFEGSEPEVDTIAEAEENLFTAAGVSSQLFNNPKASAASLLLSIKADQAITYGIVKSIEDAINRYIQYQNWGKYFKVNFLDVSTFNRKEVGDAYIKAIGYGLPFISAYCASQGIGQDEFDSMNFLENDVLKLKEVLRPLQSAATLSADSTNDPGRPQKDGTELTDSGEQSREDGDDWG